jgi:putative ABC transport system permease protein
MFGYYLDLASRSLKRNKLLTALMVLAIGLGIGASMTMITVLHVMSGDPLPGRNGEIYYPHLDPLPLNYQQGTYAPDPSVNFTWPDAMALLAAPHVENQAVMTGGQVLVRPASTNLHPFHIDGRFTTAGFFDLFGRSFLHGRSWTTADDDARSHVVVLSASLMHQIVRDYRQYRSHGAL